MYLMINLLLGTYYGISRYCSVRILKPYLSACSITTSLRKIFVVEAPRQEVPSDRFNKRSQVISDQLTKLQEKQDDIALYLYGFSAPQKRVQKTHNEWKGKLVEVTRRLQSETDLMNDLFADLPFVDDCIAGFHTMIVLMVKKHILSEKNTLLLSWLQEAEYEKALTFCKTMIEKAEKIFAMKGGDEGAKLVNCKQLVDQIVQEIETSREKTKGLDKKVCQGIQIIHKQVVRFYRYCLASITPPRYFDQLRDGLVERLKTALPSRSDVETITDLLEQLSIDLPTKEKLSLKSNRYFRHGQWLTRARYPQIYPTIEKMQATAEKLQHLQEQQEERCKALTRSRSADFVSETLATDIVALDRLKNTLDRQREELLKLGFSVEIHAGLYYARELLSLIQESEYINALLSHLATNPFGNICDALKKLLFFIASNPSGKTIDDLANLLELAQDVERCSFADESAHPFVKSVCHMYLEAMSVTLARLGKRLLSFDSKSHAKVLARDHTFEDSLQEELLLYVATECLRYSYFDKKRGNPEFDLRIHILLTHPTYRLSRAANRKFHAILTEYTIFNPPAIDAKEVNDSFCFIFHHLDRLSSTEASIDLDNRSIEDIYLFASAHAWLLEIRLLQISSPRARTLHALAQEKLKRAATLRGYLEYCLDIGVHFKDCTLIVYPFVEGQNGFSRDLTDNQWLSLGTTLRQIHEIDVPPSIQKKIRREAYSPKWREAVRSLYIHIEARPIGDRVALKLLKFIKENILVVRRLVDRAEQLGRQIQNVSPKFVKCGKMRAIFQH